MTLFPYVRPHRRIVVPLAMLLAGCASTGDDPFCVKWEDGQPVAIKFMPSREQAKAFNNEHGFTDTAPPFAGAGPESKKGGG